MTMENDLVERLRRQYRDGLMFLPDDFKIVGYDEAADRIQALEAELARKTEEKQAVITLLYTDEVFVGSHWEDYPNADKGVWPSLCAHAWSYGADGEEIPEDQIVPLAKLVDQFGSPAIQAWVCDRRGIEKPVKGSLSDKGKEALAHLRAARSALEKKTDV